MSGRLNAALGRRCACGSSTVRGHRKHLHKQESQKSWFQKKGRRVPLLFLFRSSCNTQQEAIFFFMFCLDECVLMHRCMLGDFFFVLHTCIGHSETSGPPNKRCKYLMDDCRNSLGGRKARPPPPCRSVSFHKTRYLDSFIIFSPQCQLPSAVHHLRSTRVEQPCSVCNGSPGGGPNTSLCGRDGVGDLPVQRNSDLRDYTSTFRV